jgi:hypothetical protein
LNFSKFFQICKMGRYKGDKPRAMPAKDSASTRTKPSLSPSLPSTNESTIVESLDLKNLQVSKEVASESSVETCFICTEEIQVYSVGQCKLIVTI